MTQSHAEREADDETLTASDTDVPQWRAWLIASRPHTIPASASPVIVGTGLAIHADVFSPLPALAALIGAIFIQIGANLANDYYDYEKGVDTDESAGYVRVSQSGLIPAKRVFAGAVLSFAVSFAVGIYLVSVGGLPIVIVGLLSIASGFAYSGGPYPIGYHGLGDLFTFVFFGLVAVSGTYYVQAASSLASGFPLWVPPGTLPLSAVVASFPMASLITNILIVNNIRDIEDDAQGGKRTLAVILGYRGSRAEYVLMMVLAYLSPVWFYFRPEYGPAVLIPFLSLPFAVLVTRRVLTERDTAGLNPALERTGQLTFIFAVLFAIGFIV
ncbi:MAG: 1,4-dihydroxy-2-naphthoate polyprenyltransferase [Halodesulfurarchaeum sp.]